MMKHPSRNAVTSQAAQADETLIQQLGAVLDEIGVARFAGRIHSGVIDSEAGYEVLGRFAAQQERRPLLSEFTDILFARRVPTRR